MKKCICILILFLMPRPGVGQFLSSRMPQAPVSECDYCGCAQGISPLETGSTGIRYEIGSLSLGAPYYGTAKQANAENRSESFLTNKLTVYYRFGVSPWTISASVPFVNRESHEPADNSGTLQTFKGNGVGDISFIMRYNHLHHIDESTIALSVGAGVKLPTGKDNIVLPSGDYLDPDLQPGTGTTDVLLTGGGLWSYDRFGVAVNAMAGFITGAGAPGSTGNHKYGDYINGDVTLRYRVIPAEASESNLSLMFGVGAENRAHETIGAEVITASGGSIIYVAPGLKYIISTGISADATFQIPVYQYLGWDQATGDSQLGQNFRFIAGLQFQL